MGKLAILLGLPGSRGDDSRQPDDQEEKYEDISETPEFAEMFSAFCDSLGITPKDEARARRRFAALLRIWCYADDEAGDY